MPVNTAIYLLKKLRVLKLRWHGRKKWGLTIWFKFCCDIFCTGGGPDACCCPAGIPILLLCGPEPAVCDRWFDISTTNYLRRVAVSSSMGQLYPRGGISHHTPKNNFGLWALMNCKGMKLVICQGLVSRWPDHARQFRLENMALLQLPAEPHSLNMEHQQASQTNLSVTSNTTFVIYRKYWGC